MVLSADKMLSVVRIYVQKWLADTCIELIRHCPSRLRGIFGENALIDFPPKNSVKLECSNLLDKSSPLPQSLREHYFWRQRGYFLAF